jgi:protein-disulfide isomerase
MIAGWAQPRSDTQVPKKRKKLASLYCAVALALAGPAGAADRPSETAALIEGEAISIPELDRRMPAEVYEARRAIYEARRTVLQELIDERLLARAAAAAGESVEVFRNKAIIVDPSAITDADIEAVFAEFEIDPEDMTPSTRLIVQIALVRELEQKKEEALLAELRTRYAVEIKLPAPRMPADLRVRVEGPENLVRGAGTDAPLELVVFTGFDCAYCAKLVPTLDRLEAVYPDELRIVLRHAPLAGLDSEGSEAAEASLCAADQGRFWNYHDALFAGQNLEREGLMAAADQVGLDSKTFAACLDGHHHRSRVETDIAEAERVAVTGTPTLFLNGVRIEGAKSFDEIQGYIESELTLAPRGMAQQQPLEVPVLAGSI